MAEALFDHHPERREVGAVLREGVRGDQPSALAERVRNVEDSEVVDLRGKREREDRQLVSAGQERERPSSPIWSASRVATSLE